MAKRSDAVARLKPTTCVSAVIAAMIAATIGLGTIAAVAQDDPDATPKTDAPKPVKPAVKPAVQKPAQAPVKPAAPAAGAPAPASDPAAAQQQDPSKASRWVKFCSKDPEGKLICLTLLELQDERGQAVASVALREIDGDPKKTLLISVPPLMLIQPGLRVQVDKGKQEEGKFTICFTNACVAEVPASDALIQQMKKGQALYIVTLNTQQKAITFPFNLFGFKEKNEGQGIDPAEIAKQRGEQQQLQDQLQKKADEAAKSLGAKPADAPAAPAAPAPKP